MVKVVDIPRSIVSVSDATMAQIPVLDASNRGGGSVQISAELSVLVATRSG